MKKLAMCATAAMSVWLAGCGGAPSSSDFESKLKEYNSKIEIKMPDELVKKSVEVYKKSSSAMQQEQYDKLMKKLEGLGK